MPDAPTSGCAIHFPHWYDELAQEEFAARGYLPETVVELSNGLRYELYFYDPVRLGQDLAADVRHGTPCIAEINLVVVPEITPANIRTAVEYLLTTDYFQKIKPVETAV